jgi:P-type Ca2+ transporter type 2C
MRPSDDVVPELARLAVRDVFSALGSSDAGLENAAAAVLLSRDGPNAIPDAPRGSLLRRLAGTFGHLMAVLLWVGGGVAFAAGLPQLGVAIWIVNVVNGLFAFWQEHRAERATAALRNLLPAQSTVVRDGIPARIPADTLVVGDLLLLEEGDRISADARLVDDADLRVDQSTLTGEFRAAHKTSGPCDPGRGASVDIPNMVFAGTTVASGRARAVVSAVGSATRLGRVATLTQAMREMPSPLQRELRRLSIIVSIVAVTVGVGFFTLALSLGGLSLTRGLVFALGMIVAFVPEGLLPTVTLSLAMGTQRMAKRNALVKRLSAVEALGSTTVICTDKTGTLTQNEMTVSIAVVGGTAYRFSGVGYRPEGSVTPSVSPRLVELFEVASSACNARVERDERDGWRAIGDPTEAAIVTAGRKLSVAPSWTRAAEIPFDSRRRRMSTIDVRPGRVELHVKGAADALLSLSTTVWDEQGSLTLDEGGRQRWRLEMDRLSARGLRVLGVARRELAAVPTRAPVDELERDLEFCGLIAMHDPPRPEVEAAVAACTRAGIRIVMITGDYGVTAKAIGRQVGMVEVGTRVVNGDELDRMSDAELESVLGSAVLFARAGPEHKMRVVETLQALNDVVAVTGDGVNDAPALKRADIGIAMGLAGTDVAREAADMVLLDDNFASIVAAVEEGRAVFTNIRRFTTYILTSNTPEAVPFVVFALTGGVVPLALDVMHILAVDLGTDLVPALALGAEPPDSGIMDRPPRPRDEHVVDRALLARAYLWLGPVQAGFVMSAFFAAFRLLGHPDVGALPDSGGDYRAATAMALAAVVSTQIGNLFAQRSSRVAGLRANPMLVVGVVSEVVVIAAIVWIPWLSDIVGTAPFPWPGWLLLLPGVVLLPIVDAARARIVRDETGTGGVAR